MTTKTAMAEHEISIKETPFSFLHDDIRKEFGEEQGGKIFRDAELIYRELLQKSDDRGSEAVRDHLQNKLLLPLAYYQALTAAGTDREKALECVRKETRKTAERKREKLKKLARMPFSYEIYRMGVKRYMKNNFPQEGWETEWVSRGRHQIAFNLHRCLYADVTAACGCPELCCVYCENDDIAFSGLLPKIQFQRSGTLAGGASCCDFHFIRK